MHPFEILNSKIIHQGRAFSVQQVLVSLPDGSQKTYDLVRHTDAVTLVPVDVAGNLYFVNQYRIGAGQQLLELPAGNLEKDEEPVMGAGRELREEIGMAAGQLILIGTTYLSPGYSSEFMRFYLATGLYSAPLQADADEFIQIVTIPAAEAYRRAAAGAIQDGKSLAALFLARPHLEKIFGPL
jgi:ADP-ribose pyrophosphatase